MQLEIFAELLKKSPSCGYRLKLIGGARNKEDLERVDMLKSVAKDLNIQV